MCFRPAEISMKKCPNCGFDNKPIAKECAECGTPLENKKIDFDADQASLDASMTMNPTAPKAPDVTGAPSVPGASKPPSAS